MSEPGELIFDNIVLTLVIWALKKPKKANEARHIKGAVNNSKASGHLTRQGLNLLSQLTNQFFSLAKSFVGVDKLPVSDRIELDPMPKAHLQVDHCCGK
ncbi:MAG: hypothetical protein KGI91_01600 [Burkholderiales bacterium]|nr:hypothetical protein [Burkholderiales bacterium]